MAPHDPARHHRHSLRLPGYDYAQPGAYFMTICTHNRVCSLGEMADGQMQLTDWGRVVAECWAAIRDHFVHLTLDEWVVMPNHMHGFLLIANPVGARQCRAPTTPTEQFGQPVPGSIPTILRSFKSAVTRCINLLRGSTTPPVWQRDYYEHVVRDKSELSAIRQYIRQNPAKWNLDRNNTADQYTREAKP